MNTLQKFGIIFFFCSVTSCLPKPPPFPPSFDNRNYIPCRVFVVQFLIIQFCPPSCLLRQQVLPPYHPILLSSNLILSFHLRLTLGCRLVWSVFHTGNVFAFFFTHSCWKPCLSHATWFDRPNNIQRGIQAVQIVKLLIMEFSLISFHLGPDAVLCSRGVVITKINSLC